MKFGYILFWKSCCFVAGVCDTWLRVETMEGNIGQEGWGHRGM